MGFHPRHIVDLVGTAADILEYPYGFPTPPFEFYLCFDDWAARWRDAHGTMAASIELCQVLERFVADISISATRLEIAKGRVKYTRQYTEVMRDNILPEYNACLQRAVEEINCEPQAENSNLEGALAYAGYLRASIKKANAGIELNEGRLEEALILLNQAQAEHADYVTQNDHICTVQDVEHVLSQQCSTHSRTDA
ncbi:hypothetical protein FBU31_000317 [Coemansia sp. 'formosensis']|nr:hypothetical protein FBU31_000317 [Coemansia sp. 'formosensis']